MGQTDKTHFGNTVIICECSGGSPSSSSISSEVDTIDRCRSGRRTKAEKGRRSSSSLSVKTEPDADRKYRRSSSRTRSRSPDVKALHRATNIGHNSQIRYGNTLTVEDFFGERPSSSLSMKSEQEEDQKHSRKSKTSSSRTRSISPDVKTLHSVTNNSQSRYGNTLTVEDCFSDRPSSSLSMKSEPEIRKRHNSGCKTKRPSSAVFFDEFVDKNGLTKTHSTSENSIGHQENVHTEPDAKKDLERVIDGATMSHFYTLWNRKPRSAPLGRGKLELPNSLMMLDRYRKCGCETRLHKSNCRTC